MKLISIITPCFNESENVEECSLSIKNVMKSYEGVLDYEHIFADNSSLDDTVKILRGMALVDPRIKVIVNSRNVGPFRNIWNAMKSASGDAVIPFMPADLQDPPSVIPEFLKRWQSGDLVVYGVRRNREESILMRTARNLYYRIISRFSEDDIPKNVGEFLLADRRVVDSVLEVDDEYPYVRGLIAQTSVRSSSIEYSWVKRKKGKSKLNFFHLVDQAINGFVSTSRVPARFALLSGFFFSLIGLVGAIIVLALVTFRTKYTISGIPTIVVSIFFFSGLQLFFLGLIGEYVLSIHGQVRRVPKMFEIERINF
jgi:glycosyltransferase involved in cell wall biosynthesis